MDGEDPIALLSTPRGGEAVIIEPRGCSEGRKVLVRGSGACTLFPCFCVLLAAICAYTDASRWASWASLCSSHCVNSRVPGPLEWQASLALVLLQGQESDGPAPVFAQWL